MRTPDRIGSWPVYWQLTGTDRRGLGVAAASGRPHVARTSTADAVVKSVCPYCAVDSQQALELLLDKTRDTASNPEFLRQVQRSR